MAKGLEVLFNFMTPNGTELPVVGIHGKPYLQVAHRLIWFREEKPDWSIETDLTSLSSTAAYVRASIKDDKGRTMATAHKVETVQGFSDFVEKAETGAIGRALALVGFGTQFTADEFDEKERLADGPTEVPKASAAKEAAKRIDPENRAAPTVESLKTKVIKVGFLNGVMFADTDPYELRKQYDYWKKRDEDGKANVFQKEFVADAALWLMQYKPGDKPKAKPRPKAAGGLNA